MKQEYQTVQQYQYLENAKIIDICKLPQVGDEHEIFNNEICIEVKIVDFVEGYIIYQATFCEKDSLHILDDFFVDCCHWLYAVKNFKQQY